jgi:ABC-2 type transport system permease protein
MKTWRVIAANWGLHLKQFTRSESYLLVSVVQPMIYASLGFFMFKYGGTGINLLYVALGAGYLGIWSSTISGSGDALQFARFQGTLELLIAAPTSFLAIMLGFTLATATLGLYSVVVTLVWGAIAFGVHVHLEHPVLFLVAIPVSVVSLGALGLLVASSFVLYPNANALTNLLQYPVYLVAGLLAPLTTLPGWLHPIAYALAPTWGVRAAREAALGGDALAPIAMCVGLAAVYLLGAGLFLRHFELLARKRAALPLK